MLSMKKIGFRLMIGAALIATLSACSTQWREADGQIDAQGVFDILNKTYSQSSTSTTVSQFMQYINDPNLAIYFADAPGSLGPIASIASFTDFSFLDASINSPFPHDDLAAIRVFFIDVPTASGRVNGLMFGLRHAQDQNFSTYALMSSSSNPGSVQNGEFAVTLSNGSQDTLYVTSDDVDDHGELKGVIQLHLYQIDAYGDGNYIGKISTMIGFGP